jgi:hypothetical protein
VTSTNARGNYYKNKTRDWYQERGYTVQLTEFLTARPVGGGRIIYSKKDVFGSDGISMNGKEIIFWNSKAASSHRQVIDLKSKGKKEFGNYPFPECVKLQLVIWEPRKSPVIIKVEH